MKPIVLIKDYEKFKSAIVQASDKYCEKILVKIPVLDYINGQGEYASGFHNFLLNLSLARYIISNLEKNKNYSNYIYTGKLKAALERSGVYCPHTDLNIIGIIDGFCKLGVGDYFDLPLRISSKSIQWLSESKIIVDTPVSEIGSGLLRIEEFVWTENNQVLSTSFKIERQSINCF